MPIGEDEMRSLVRELAGAVSTQAQVANRAWIALMTVAFFAVLPRSPSKAGNLPLPFNLGEVDAAWFHVVAFSILVVLTITFAAAHAQQIRAQRLAQSFVDSLGCNHSSSNELISLRELFDMWRAPSLNRIAPLAQLLRGRYQFQKGAAGCPTWLRFVTVVYYGLFKIASLAVFFGLPVWALWHSYVTTVSLSPQLHLVLGIGGVLAGLPLAQVGLTDAAYTIEVLRHLWQAPASAR
jgi:hypothetical protein